MADVVTSQTIEAGHRNLVMSFTNVSDGTGESGVIKVNATTDHGITVQGQTFYPGVNLKVLRIVYDVQGMVVELQWVATTNQNFAILSGFGELDYRKFGGLWNPGTTSLPGATGSIAFSTINQFPGSSYVITLFMTKGIPQF